MEDVTRNKRILGLDYARAQELGTKLNNRKWDTDERYQ
jgi:hypothetical protein